MSRDFETGLDRQERLLLNLINHIRLFSEDAKQAQKNIDDIIKSNKKKSMRIE